MVGRATLDLRGRKPARRNAEKNDTLKTFVYELKEEVESDSGTMDMALMELRQPRMSNRWMSSLAVTQRDVDAASERWENVGCCVENLKRRQRDPLEMERARRRVRRRFQSEVSTSDTTLQARHVFQHLPEIHPILRRAQYAHSIPWICALASAIPGTSLI